MRVGLELVLRESVANRVGGNHAAVVVRVLDKVLFKHHLDDGRSLAMAGDDEGATVVVVLEVIVQRCDDVAIRSFGKGCVEDSVSLPDYPGIMQTHLTVEWHKHIGGIGVCRGMQRIFARGTLQHFGIVHVGISGSTLGHAAQYILGCIYIEGVEFLGDFRNLIPVGFIGIIQR